MTTNKLPIPSQADACLMLADGKVFFGRGIGAAGIKAGEICFNTAMTGYQEILTDPSFAGQIITFTFPHIGNTGCNEEDIEALTPHASGLILREAPTLPSNFRSRISFNDWLISHNITGISGIDTRALTRHIREHGAQNAAIQHLVNGAAFDEEAIKEAIASCPDMTGCELAATVTANASYNWNQSSWALGSGYGMLASPQYHVVAIDYGEKLNILRCLVQRQCKVTVVPAQTSAADILKLKPNGIFLSNGPGDPSATGNYAVPVLQNLIDSGIPIFGICLGHQLLARALGGQTIKMPQGHRGANHPVKNLENNTVEITSQNHGFAVVAEGLPSNVKVTHISLFDGTVEGLKVTDKPVFSVQYHPESSPGPHDSVYLFDSFVKMMKEHRHG